MTVNPFWMGVLATLFAEMAALILFVVVAAIKENKKR